MKKIICALLIVAMIAPALASCAKKEGDEQKPDTTTAPETETTATLPDYVGNPPAETEADGSFILTSTDDRVVFTYSEGYVVFTFAGEAVSKIQRVICFETVEDAQEYVSEKRTEATNNGETPTTMIVNGSNVIIPVGFNATEKSLGSYYMKSKTAVLEDFANEVKQ